jgi:hypothetical protein
LHCFVLWGEKHLQIVNEFSNGELKQPRKRPVVNHSIKFFSNTNRLKIKTIQDQNLFAFFKRTFAQAFSDNPNCLDHNECQKGIDLSILKAKEYTLESDLSLGIESAQTAMFSN